MLELSARLSVLIGQKLLLRLARKLVARAMERPEIRKMVNERERVLRTRELIRQAEARIDRERELEVN